ncbi:MAG: ribosome silencing factor [Thermoguttaceae bacterium]|nr:ribosome silencing factor [Thermoguttaceae bacterium]MDW8036618.1 ribosome silencing factor [Thermoguttaceae bacterium]
MAKQKQPSSSRRQQVAVALQRAARAAQTAQQLQGRDVLVLDMRKLTTLFDYFVLATGTSRRQLHAMSEEIDRVLEREMGDRRIGLEGYEDSRWIVMDYGDVVVHLFDEATRAYYALEELWAQARRVNWQRVLTRMSAANDQQKS